MKSLIDLCVSRELAERMRALGYPQEGLFYWRQEMENYTWVDKWKLDNEKYDSYFQSDKRQFAAPTAGELGEELKESRFPFPCLNEERKWFIPVNGWTIFEGKEWENEAEARGEMWCYLKEQGLI